jgi:hypothetical protein
MVSSIWRRCGKSPPNRIGRCPADAPGGQVQRRSPARIPKRVSARERVEATPSPPLPPLERREYEFGELDRWLDLADQAIPRAQRIVEEYAG